VRLGALVFSRDTSPGLIGARWRNGRRVASGASVPSGLGVQVPLRPHIQMRRGPPLFGVNRIDLLNHGNCLRTNVGRCGVFVPRTVVLAEWRLADTALVSGGTDFSAACPPEVGRLQAVDNASVLADPATVDISKDRQSGRNPTKA